MHGESERILRDYVRVVADECKGCFRRGTAACFQCPASGAGPALERSGLAAKAEMGVAAHSRGVERWFASVLGQLRQPLTAREIDVRGCPAKMKSKMLQDMADEGLVTVSRTASGAKAYAITAKGVGYAGLAPPDGRNAK